MVCGDLYGLKVWFSDLRLREIIDTKPLYVEVFQYICIGYGLYGQLWKGSVYIQPSEKSRPSCYLNLV
jgi:hypothetical protein